LNTFEGSLHLKLEKLKFQGLQHLFKQPDVRENGILPQSVFKHTHPRVLRSWLILADIRLFSGSQTHVRLSAARQLGEECTQGFDRKQTFSIAESPSSAQSSKKH
jgi:hypothetical protein